RFMLDDHLGSTHVIADASGKKEQVMSFDVFGARRNATTWARDFSDQNKFTSKLTLRGYTGHEQMDEVGLVHMGGRVYDPILGRFLQADPMVQAPHNIQNLNRYSYVVNNPLNKTDPSGYIFATIAVWALNAAISQGIITGVTATVLSGLLTAYSYYGYAKLAVGIIQAANQGGTALANFAGGWAKGFAKGQAVTCMLNMAAGGGCIDGLETKQQGSADTDGNPNPQKQRETEQTTEVKDTRSASSTGPVKDLTEEQVNDINKTLSELQSKLDKKNNSGGFNTAEEVAEWFHDNVHPLSEKYDMEIGAEIFKNDMVYNPKLGQVETKFYGGSIVTDFMHDSVTVSDSTFGNFKPFSDWHSHGFSNIGFTAGADTSTVTSGSMSVVFLSRGPSGGDVSLWSYKTGGTTTKLCGKKCN
ncbi:RHS repeat-associated core domain-containing protein, partial [Pseudoalteromonas sp. McH1-42]|uniref:RHS repeat domain-containing protein n=1 Tax=Pseudoalteromonas sp. McH1-42 TaxID=2917752 RepID=UPI001EF66793